MKNLKNKLNSKKGFTLIELLVVVAIIALLSAVVLSSIDESRLRAEWRGFDSNIYQIRNAMQLYQTQFGVWPYELLSNQNSAGINSFLGPMVAAGIYNGPVELTAPNGNDVFVYRSTRLQRSSGDYISCGSDRNSEVIMTIAVQATNHRSSLFRQAYTETSAMGSQHLCVEIR